MAQAVTRVVHRCEDAVESEYLGEKSDRKRLCICIYFENLIKNYWTSEGIHSYITSHSQPVHISRPQSSISFLLCIMIMYGRKHFLLSTLYEKNG